MAVKFPWSRGPSIPFLDNIATYRVEYRYRMPGEATWTKARIDMTARNKKHCYERTIRFISQKWRAEVEVIRVNLLTKEMFLQTGDPVEQVSEDEYTKRTEKLMEDTKEGIEERKAKLREGGLWIPK